MARAELRREKNKLYVQAYRARQEKQKRLERRQQTAAEALQRQQMQQIIREIEHEMQDLIARRIAYLKSLWQLP